MLLLLVQDSRPLLYVVTLYPVLRIACCVRSVFHTRNTEHASRPHAASSSIASLQHRGVNIPVPFLTTATSAPQISQR